VGAVAVDLFMLSLAAPAWLGFDANAWLMSPDIFLPPGSFIVGTFGNIDDAVFVALTYLFVLTLVTTAVRDARLAALICAVTVAAWQVQTLYEPWWFTAPLTVAAFLLNFLLLTKVGWVAVTIGRLVGGTLLLAPLTFDRSIWYVDASYASLGLLAALTFYGVYVASFAGGARMSSSFARPV